MKEIIEKFKEINILDLKEDQIHNNNSIDDYLYCKEVFKRYCRYLKIPETNTSFYYFCREFGKLKFYTNSFEQITFYCECNLIYINKWDNGGLSELIKKNKKFLKILENGNRD